MIFFLLPAYNEAESIAKTLQNIHAEMKNISKLHTTYEYKIIVCNNNSTDNTAEIAEKNNSTVVHEKISGYGHTLMKGIEYLAKNYTNIDTSEKIIIFMDADGQDNPHNIYTHIKNLQTAKFSIASRINTVHNKKTNAVSTLHTFVNKLFGYLLYLRCGKKFADLGPFRALHLKTFLQLNMQELTFGWTAEMQKKIAIKNISYTEFYSQPFQRFAGTSKVSGSAIWKQIKIGLQIIWVIIQ